PRGVPHQMSGLRREGVLTISLSHRESDGRGPPGTAPRSHLAWAQPVAKWGLVAQCHQSPSTPPTESCPNSWVDYGAVD
ncbi:MAG: hypothetical protein M0027_11990, partial [Candidatus Dormibacteraeota bacterium]|nr:hypothetical protein [Candidatus Dormibacteraeota bacterium]